jgi:TRAP-type transport system periplasmic protein
MRAFPVLVILATALCALPSSSTTRAQEADAQLIIKVATMAPRSAEFVRREKRYNLRLDEETHGRIQFRTYWGGIAGDEQTVMRKLRSGQIDAAPLGTDTASRAVRQAMVLMAPQTFFNYKQVDAVRKALAPEFNQEAYQNGFKILSWWDAGRARIFSNRPIRTFTDLRVGRPWLYPPSSMLREFYKMINVTGVPLEISEVYGGLQTKMIDTVWISPVLVGALRWSAHVKYMSASPATIIQGAFVLRRPTWDAMSKEDQEAMDRIVKEQSVKFQADFREDDERAFVKLQTRGITAVPFTNPEEWRAVGRQLRNKMIGRAYSKEMLARVEAITKQYTDPSDPVSVR